MSLAVSTKVGKNQSDTRFCTTYNRNFLEQGLGIYTIETAARGCVARLGILENHAVT